MFIPNAEHIFQAPKNIKTQVTHLGYINILRTLFSCRDQNVI